MNKRSNIVFAILIVGVLISGIVFGWVNPSNSPSSGFGGIRTSGGDNPNLGIGLTGSELPKNKLAVKGNVAIGSTYFASEAPVSGLLIEGSLVIGTTDAPLTKLSIDGGFQIGDTSQRLFPGSNVPVKNIGTSISTHVAQGDGKYTALTIGSDGLPFVIYASEDDKLFVVKCLEIDCKTFSTPYEVSGSTVTYIAVAIEQNGYPIISYIKNGTTLMFLGCLDHACSNSNGDSIILGEAANRTTSITVDINGNPLIAFQGNNRAHVASCTNSSCSGVNVYEIDSTSGTGHHNSIAIGADGYPIISYYYGAGGELRVAHCGGSSNCGSGTITVTILDGCSSGCPSSGNVGLYTSIAIGEDHFPMIVYYDADGANLVGIKCGDFKCTNTFITRETIDGQGGINAGKYSSLVISPDGKPFIAYYDESAAWLKIVKCGHDGCAGNNINWDRNVKQASPSELFASVAIGVDGLPIISYLNQNDRVRVFHCGAENCIDYWTRR